MEERVARLEEMVAVQPEALHGGGNLSDVAGSVLSRMALLEPEHLGQFYRQIDFFISFFPYKSKNPIKAQADARLASLVDRFSTVPESLQKLPDLTKVLIMRFTRYTFFCSVGILVLFDTSNCEPTWIAWRASCISRQSWLITSCTGKITSTNHFTTRSHWRYSIDVKLEKKKHFLATQNELHAAMNQNIQVASENAKKLNARVEKLNWK